MQGDLGGRIAGLPLTLDGACSTFQWAEAVLRTLTALSVAVNSWLLALQLLRCHPGRPKEAEVFICSSARNAYWEPLREASWGLDLKQLASRTLAFLAIPIRH